MSTTDWREVAKESGWDVTFDYYDVRVQRMAEEILRLREIEKLHNDAVTEFCDKVNAQTAYSGKLLMALTVSGDRIHDEFCGHEEHHPFCTDIDQILALPRPGEEK